MKIWPIAALALAAPAGAQAPAAQIDHIGMQLFYSYSGKLSKDISPPVEFLAWNTVIGEGEAEEPADDMLVTVHLKGKPEAGGFTPVTISAKDGKGKLLGKRLAQPYLSDDQGRAVVGLWLHDVGCAGKVTVTAKMGKQVKSEAIDLNCGE